MSDKKASPPPWDVGKDLPALVDSILKSCRTRGYVLRKLTIPGHVEIDLSLAPEEASAAIDNVKAKIRGMRDMSLLGYEPQE